MFLPYGFIIGVIVFLSFSSSPFHFAHCTSFFCLRFLILILPLPLPLSLPLHLLQRSSSPIPFRYHCSFIYISSYSHPSSLLPLPLLLVPPSLLPNIGVIYSFLTSFSTPHPLPSFYYHFFFSIYFYFIIFSLLSLPSLHLNLHSLSLIVSILFDSHFDTFLISQFFSAFFLLVLPFSFCLLPSILPASFFLSFSFSLFANCLHLLPSFICFLLLLLGMTVKIFPSDD